MWVFRWIVDKLLHFGGLLEASNDITNSSYWTCVMTWQGVFDRGPIFGAF